MYSSEEKETTCVFDYEAGAWTIYSCVPTHMTKLLKVAGEPFWKEEEPGANGEPRMVAGKWKLGPKQVRFASPPSERDYSEAAERMRQLHAKKKEKAEEDET
ncbi:hypothetical protein J31TS4_18730 [Paenibacillus sp. J31TS4]|uniref:hypothetical protein n=1 Tax=Paenibacillus sp. J31TS4 TaxID=2807195 RepID=UPI001B149F22|nr:hypothetical protein [Paenibacillus sp. J31TS4]GIP38593.1 hypothetical protein J31TS4_18730 [Paenibacillus sp. J31TS4]